MRPLTFIDSRRHDNVRHRYPESGFSSTEADSSPSSTGISADIVGSASLQRADNSFGGLVWFTPLDRNSKYKSRVRRKTYDFGQTERHYLLFLVTVELGANV